jgi:hypothetical protein
VSRGSAQLQIALSAREAGRLSRRLPPEFSLEWDTEITLAGLREAHKQEVNDAEHYLSAHVQTFMKEFRQTFPDYKCDYTFYIAPSFGRMDGSAGLVNDRPLIIFAPDVGASYGLLRRRKDGIRRELTSVASITSITSDRQSRLPPPPLLAGAAGAAGVALASADGADAPPAFTAATVK